MIKNVILDMGNVLMEYAPDKVLDAFCRSEEEKEIIRRELFLGPEWVQGDRGDIADRDRFDLVKRRVPEEYWEDLRRCCNEWYLVCMDPLPGAVEFCHWAREQEYGLYILSNASDAFYEYFPKFLPLEFFDGAVVSADVHLLKPGREIYEYLTEKYSLRAEECLFVDDTPANVEGARAVGMAGLPFLGDHEAIKRRLTE